MFLGLQHRQGMIEIGSPEEYEIFMGFIKSDYEVEQQPLEVKKLIDNKNQLYENLNQTSDSGEKGIDEGDEKNDVIKKHRYRVVSASRQIFRLK